MVALAKVSPKTRCWLDPKVLNPLKGHALNLRRVAQRKKERADKIAYGVAQTKFQKAVKDFKHHHWHRFFENLTNKDLFTAERYFNDALPPPPSSPHSIMPKIPSQTTQDSKPSCFLKKLAVQPLTVNSQML